MANTASATITIGADTSALERSIRASLAKLERNSRFSPTLNDRNFALGTITGKVDDFNRSLDSANKRVLAFGANAVVIGGVIKLFKDLAGSTVQVEKQMTQINAIFGLSSKELKTFSANLFSVARNTSQSFDAVGKAAEEFARQGLNAVETLKRVNGAMTLTRQSGLEVSKSVDSITAALNGFAKENLNVEQVINKLIAVDTKFAVSSSDLAEAISRVGSTASDAGVSFDELIGLVTSAQQITARGGAVIGNSLKTIFTRLGRSETIDQLENLGIAVKDLQNNALPASTILKNLAGNFDNLTQSQKQAVVQLTAGTFQVNQLRAILSDLGREYSVVSQAQSASAAATNEAAKRNEVLNKSLSSLLQNTKSTFTEMGSIVGSATFAEPLKEALKVINDNFILDALRGSVSEESGKSVGATVASGVLKGISNILTGPGAIAIASIFGTLFSKLGVDSIKSFGTLLGGREKELKTTQAIEATLSSASSIDQRRFLTTSNIAQKEQIILEILMKQNAVRAAQAASFSGLAASISPTGGKTLRNSLKGFAEGYVPIHEEMSAISRGVGGAPSNSRPVVLSNFNFGGGRKGTVVANSSEYVVPNFANGGSAIFNQDMVKKYGIPGGASKIAAGGYIPNAADGLFSGADKFKNASNSRFASKETLTMANALAEEYLVLAKKDFDHSKATTVKKIKSLNLQQSAIDSILDTLDSESKLRKENLKTVQQQIAEEKKTTEAIRKKNNKRLEQIEEKRSFNETVNASVISSRNRQIQVATTAPFSSSQSVPSGSSSLALSSPVFQWQKQAQVDAQRDAFLKDRIALGKSKAFKNITDRAVTGGSISDQQRNFLGEEFESQGKALASKVIAPGAHKGARKAFIEEYVKDQFRQLDEAFTNATATKNQGSVFKQLQDKTSGYRNIFKNIDKEVESIIKKEKLSGPAADILRQQANGSKADRANRRQTAAFAASFALPFAAGFIDEGKGGTTGGQVRGGISGALNGAGTGLALGSMFGPVGAAIGGGVGAIGGGLVGAIGKANKSFEEISKTVNDLNAENAKQIQNVSSYIQLQQKLNDAIESGAPSKQIDSLLGDQRTSLAGIKNPSERKAILEAGGDINKLAEVLGLFNKNAQKQATAGDVVSSLGAAKNNSGFFSGLKGKDIEDSANALAVATDTSSEKIRNSLDKLKKTFQNDSLGALTNLGKDLGFSGEQIKDSIDLFKSKPDQLKLILARYIDILSESQKDIEVIARNAKRNERNIQFGKLLRRAGEENIAGAERFQNSASSQNRILNSARGTALSLQGGDILSKSRLENQLNVQNAIREANIQSQAATRRNIGKVQGVASSETSSNIYAEDIQKLSSPESFKALSDKLGFTNENLIKVLNESYNELISIRENSTLQVNETKELARITDVKLRFEERNKVLSGSVFNSNNLESFSSGRITAKSGQFARGGKANQFNALNSQIGFADQLGLGDTSNTENLRLAVRAGSSKINFAEILSTITGDKIEADETSIKAAIKKVLDKPISDINDAIDKDVVERIQNGIKVASFNSEQSLKELAQGGSGISNFVSAGKINLGEGGIISGLTGPMGVTSKLDITNNLLQEIKANKILVDNDKVRVNNESSIISIDKKIEDINRRKDKFNFSQLNGQDISSTFDSMSKGTGGKGKVRDIFQKYLGDRPGSLDSLKYQSSDIINEILSDQTLLNEAGIKKDDFKGALIKKAQSYPGGLTDKSSINIQLRDLEMQRDALIYQRNGGKDFSRLSVTNSVSDLISKYPTTEKVNRNIPALLRRRGQVADDSINYVGADGKSFSFFDNDSKLKTISNKQGQLEQNNNSKKSLEDSLKAAEAVNASYVDKIDLLQKINDLETKNAQITNSAYGTFVGGFKARMLEIRKSMNDLSDTGATVAASLDSNLGGSFGDFVTGAKKGKDAFRDFITSVLNDSARAFASKAMQGLIGNIASGISSSFTTKASGGPITALASGGNVPALVMGGEYYFTPEQVKNIEGRYGQGYVKKINEGTASVYANGGLVKGGSGMKDDVFAQLDSGGYVIKKTSVNKYGPETIDAIANNAPQKKFWGGFLVGSLIGSGISYATSNKKNRNKNALIGGLVGGIAGGFAQNYSKTGSAFKSNSSSALSPSTANSKIDYNNFNSETQTNYGNIKTSPIINNANNTSNVVQDQLSNSLWQAGIAGAIGLASAKLAKKDDSTSSAYIDPYAGMPTGTQEEIDTKKSNGEFAYLNQQGKIAGYIKRPATRLYSNGGMITGGSGVRDDIYTRLSSGGAVINRSSVNKYGASNLQKFANGGYVNSNAVQLNGNNPKNSDPSVYIKIDINNNSTNSSSEDKGNSGLGTNFAEKLAANVKSLVRDEMIQQRRTGGMESQLKRV